MKGSSTTSIPRDFASRPITTPLSSASLTLKVAARPMVAISAWEGTRVSTPGDPSDRRIGGIPRRGTPVRYPACPWFVVGSSEAPRISASFSTRASPVTTGTALCATAVSPPTARTVKTRAATRTSTRLLRFQRILIRRRFIAGLSCCRLDQKTIHSTPPSNDITISCDAKGRSCRYIKAIPARVRYNGEHRLEGIRLNASREGFDWAAVLIGLSEAAPDAVASASVASAKTGLLRTKFHHLGNALAFVLRSSAAGDMTWFQSIPGHEKLWGDAALRAC